MRIDAEYLRFPVCSSVAFQYVAGNWRTDDEFDSGFGVNEWGSHTVDLCQWANGDDNIVPIEYEAFPDKIVCTYASGVKMVLDFLKDPFGNRDPQFITPPRHLSGAL